MPVGHDVDDAGSVSFSEKSEGKPRFSRSWFSDPWSHANGPVSELARAVHLEALV